MPKCEEAVVSQHRGDETPVRIDKQSGDPITTQIIRHALTSAARQMVKATVRTAFSPVIYESLDFAVVIYDAEFRLLGQGPTLPAFMGTMSFCIRAAVDAVGGSGALNAGDVLLYNVPYGSGSHAQDCAVIVPVFDHRRVLLGFTANKAHWADIGAMAPYCTNTTDVFQEGMSLPGVKLYDAGVLNSGIFSIILANSRFPELIDGDLRAQIASCNIGASELLRIVNRFGHEVFASCVERMIVHGEAIIRAKVRELTDGVYTASCFMDDNGVDRESIEYCITVQVAGDDVIVDFTCVPDAQRGPVNCPLPSTVSLARIALGMIAGSHEAPNEGHFRPLTVLTRPGSMFHPLKPSPCFLYGWPLTSAMEGVIQAFSQCVPGLPSGSAADICYVSVYGQWNGAAFVAGGALPVGSGASYQHDGSTLFIPPLAYSRNQSSEVTELNAPIRVVKYELMPDSGGPGEFRGGCGWSFESRLLVDAQLTSTIERTKVPASGQAGAKPGMPNNGEIEYPDGKVVPLKKVTALSVPAGSLVRIVCGGGGGYGMPGNRAAENVDADLRSGLITHDHASRYYNEAKAVSATLTQ